MNFCFPLMFADKLQAFVNFNYNSYELCLMNFPFTNSFCTDLTRARLVLGELIIQCSIRLVVIPPKESLFTNLLLCLLGPSNSGSWYSSFTTW